MESNIKLFDKSKQLHVRINMNDAGDGWERWVSVNKVDWELDKVLNSLDEVLKSQQELIDNNYRNLYNLIIKK